MSNFSSKKIVVIGSGISGLAIACRLAAKGFQVIMVEKNESYGGKMDAIQKDGFVFDLGPSLFTEPENFHQLFKDCNNDFFNYVNYKPCDESCRYFFENGKSLIASSDILELDNDLKSTFGEKSDALKLYLANAKKLYHSIGNIFLNQPINKLSTWLSWNVLKSFGKIGFEDLILSLNQKNQKYFKSKEVVQIFNRFATYNGSNPYKLLGLYSMISYVELGKGVYFLENGMKDLADALFSLAKKLGVQFLFNEEAKAINLVSNKVDCVTTTKQTINADYVISDIDVYYLYKNLLKDESKANQILKQERSSSALVFYWGINKSFPQLGLHNILFSEDYQSEFDSIFKSKNIYQDPTIYINITSKLNPNHAPQGMENWFVMINIPSGIEIDKDQLAIVRKNILEKINRQLETYIEDAIVFEEILDPQKLNLKTGSFMGSIYGMSSNDRFAAFKRHPNYINSIKGLYFCGGTVHPGGGIPLCLKSAEIVANLIIEND